MRAQTPTLHTIETPRVVVDRARIAANIDAMQALAARAGVSLRPHAKTHKSPALAQQQIAAGAAGDPDPVVFPGQRVARLSDYVGLMKQMQTGNMMGALAAYGLDMTGYSQVAMAWGQKMAGDSTLTAKFSSMMAR